MNYGQLQNFFDVFQSTILPYLMFGGGSILRGVGQCRRSGLGELLVMHSFFEKKLTLTSSQSSAEQIKHILLMLIKLFIKSI